MCVTAVARHYDVVASTHNNRNATKINMFAILWSFTPRREKFSLRIYTFVPVVLRLILIHLILQHLSSSAIHIAYTVHTHKHTLINAVQSTSHQPVTIYIQNIHTLQTRNIRTETYSGKYTSLKEYFVDQEQDHHIYYNSSSPSGYTKRCQCFGFFYQLKPG